MNGRDSCWGGLLHRTNWGVRTTPDGEALEPKSKVHERNKHKIAAHRGFLTHPKVKGAGNAHQRQMMENKRRVNTAMANIYEMRQENAGAGQEEKPQDERGYQKLVEGKIQTGMAEGTVRISPPLSVWNVAARAVN